VHSPSPPADSTLPRDTINPLAIIFSLVVGVLLMLQIMHAYTAAYNDPLRQGDRLLAAGQYYAALHHYHQLAATDDSGAVLLRLGMLYTLRGEYDQAEHALWQAVTRPNRPRQHALATLYLGHVLARRGDPHHAQQVWQQWSRPCRDLRGDCTYAGPREVLQAEWALYAGNYAKARWHYRAALAVPLPTDWQEFVHYRLALLQAAAQPERALATLATAPSGGLLTPASDPLLKPLLPPHSPQQRQQLAAILEHDAAQRVRALGLFYLHHELYPLAVQQFEQVPADSPQALAAAVYSAYAHERADRSFPDPERSFPAQAELEQRAARHPDDERAESLLALTALLQDQPPDTQAISTTLGTLSATRADLQLAQGAWYVTRSEYVSATLAYQRALRLAPPARYGEYALFVARYHLTVAYDLCNVGVDVAREATRTLPDNPEAWTLLAGSLYQCGSYADAIPAAQRALAATSRADAFFYLGGALAHTGQFSHARAALIRAADLAPASQWRVRAELLLADLDALEAANARAVQRE
jgi:tetratricopeptide (TPR) repeat protein